MMLALPLQIDDDVFLFPGRINILHTRLMTLHCNVSDHYLAGRGYRCIGLRPQDVMQWKYGQFY